MPHTADQCVSPITGFHRVAAEVENETSAASPPPWSAEPNPNAAINESQRVEGKRANGRQPGRVRRGSTSWRRVSDDTESLSEQRKKSNTSMTSCPPQPPRLELCSPLSATTSSARSMEEALDTHVPKVQNVPLTSDTTSSTVVWRHSDKGGFHFSLETAARSRTVSSASHFSPSANSTQLTTICFPKPYPTKSRVPFVSVPVSPPQTPKQVKPLVMVDNGLLEPEDEEKCGCPGRQEWRGDSSRTWTRLSQDSPEREDSPACDSPPPLITAVSKSENWTADARGHSPEWPAPVSIPSSGHTSQLSPVPTDARPYAYVSVIVSSRDLGGHRVSV